MTELNHPENPGVVYGRKAYKTAQKCEKCGVMIRHVNQTLHDEWHERLRRAIEEAAPLE